MSSLFAIVGVMNYAFIDSQNVNLGVQAMGWKLDFGKFRVYLKDKYKVEKAFLFLGYLPENERFYKKLLQQNYVLIFKPAYKIKGHSIKGNVDAELVLHTMIEFPHYHKAIIITGDGDFYCLVEYLKKKDKLEKVIIPNTYKYSWLLRTFKGDITFMNEQRRKLEQKK